MTNCFHFLSHFQDVKIKINKNQANNKIKNNENEIKKTSEATKTSDISPIDHETIKKQTMSKTRFIKIVQLHID